MENSLDHKMKSRVKIVAIFLPLSSMSIATIGDLWYSAWGRCWVAYS